MDSQVTLLFPLNQISCTDCWHIDQMSCMIFAWWIWCSAKNIEGICRGPTVYRDLRDLSQRLFTTLEVRFFGLSISLKWILHNILCNSCSNFIFLKNMANSKLIACMAKVYSSNTSMMRSVLKYFSPWVIKNSCTGWGSRRWHHN